MSVQVSQVLASARTYVNDDVASKFTDAFLIPRLQEAHRELQATLRARGASTIRTVSGDIAVATNATTLTNPTDIIEPIRLWEKATADPSTAYVLMTEADPMLPDMAKATTLGYWQWADEVFQFIGASTDRKVRILYTRLLTIPTLNTDTIGFINGELWLAPRTAALAALSLGNQPFHDICTATATSRLDLVIAANRGTSVPTNGASPRP